MSRSRGRTSATCTGKATGKPLSEYDTKDDALSGATFVLEKYGNKMVPYKCDKCHYYWHLAPASSSSSTDRHHKGSIRTATKRTTHNKNKSRTSTTCTGKATGKSLTEYDTKEDAISGATFVLEKYGTVMVPYECDRCHFWHLAPPSSSTTTTDKKQQKITKHSSTCFGKVSGEILTEYTTKQEADASATFVFEKHGRRMVPYHCPTCFQWHISPMDRQTQHAVELCSCVDEMKIPKDGYQTKQDAQRRAQILLKEMGQLLYVYQCPETTTTTTTISGARGNSRIWHLTKKAPGQYHHHHHHHETRPNTSRKSTTCRSKQGTFRMEYDSEDAATNGAEYATERYGRQFSPYHCPTCDKWHIG